MTKPKTPIYASGPMPVMVKVGEIAGCPIYVHLTGLADDRDRKFMLVQTFLNETMKGATRA